MEQGVNGHVGVKGLSGVNGAGIGFGVNGGTGGFQAVMEDHLAYIPRPKSDLYLSTSFFYIKNISIYTSLPEIDKRKHSIAFVCVCRHMCLCVCIACVRLFW